MTKAMERLRKLRAALHQQARAGLAKANETVNRLEDQVGLLHAQLVARDPDVQITAAQLQTTEWVMRAAHAAIAQAHARREASVKDERQRALERRQIDRLHQRDELRQRATAQRAEQRALETWTEACWRPR